ncbi:MAG: hypothetical protein FJY73_12715 [Candidatus Eisenbacteria bacterium]|nr:hypothetical protein [Candidatus Eisenbacteria bacterium]
MRNRRALLVFPLAALFAAGCLVSGQLILVQVFGDGESSADKTVHRISVDLNGNEDYDEHKDKLQSLEYFGFFVTVTNEGPGEAKGAMYLSLVDLGVSPSIATIKAQATPIIENANLGAGETRTITFEESQDYITNLDAIEEAVLEGVFYLYGITDLGTAVEYENFIVVASINVAL